MGFGERIAATFKDVYSTHLRSTTTRLGIHSKLHVLYWGIRHSKSDTPIRLKTHSGVIRSAIHDGSLLVYPEREVVQDVLETITPGDTFYDVGANVGRYSVPVGLFHDDVGVYAFEPVEQNIRLLRQNGKAHDVDINIIDGALSDKSGKSRLVLSDDPSRHRLATEDRNNDQQLENIQMYRGDELIDCGKIPAPDVVKIDVEGAEMRVIEGLAESLQECGCNTIYCELHPKLMEKHDDTVDMVSTKLNSMGYDVDTLNEREITIQNNNVSQHFIKAVR